jgi:DUF2939 family protein
MRKLAAAIAILLVVLVGYSAWPFASLYGLARAVEARDVGAVRERVDFPAVRRNLIDQIMQAYLRLSGKTASSLAANLAVAVAASIADPLVEKLVTPENLVALLARGWPQEGAGDKPPDIAGLALPPLGGIAQLYRNTEYGTGWARVSVPVDRPAQKQFRLRLRLTGANWVLSGVDLPVELQERLAQELIKLEKR